MKMKIRRARNGFSPGAQVHRILMNLVAQAGLDLDRMPGLPDHSNHAIRTRMKKFRSVLRLARASLPEQRRKAISNLARDIKDAFDGLRNQAVLRKLAHKLSLQEPGSTLTSEALAPLMSRVRQKVRRLRQLVARARISGLRWHAVGKAHAATYRAGRQAMKCAAGFESGALHEWRKRVKDLHHQALALRRLGGMKKRIKLSDRLGSRLGKHRDLDALTAFRGPATATVDAILEESKTAALEKSISSTGRRLYAKKANDVRRSLLRRCKKDAS